VTDAPTILIADDDARTRAAVREAVERGGFTVCAEAANADTAIAAAEAEAPDIALLDIGMPGNGIRAAAEIAISRPDVAIVMLTVSRDDDDLFAALRAGASGYLLKDTDGEQLPRVLRAVLDGEAVLSRSLTARVINEFRARARRGDRSVRLPCGEEARLTSREWQVLECLGDGSTTAEIAERLFVSNVTVRTHVSAILRKLRVANREEAARLFRGD
jgi:DNA-binding NarL/FixJ family response regulator